ncbi:MAG TPA: hypothetical protein VKC66_02180 [Xanthobacteraceae bacterium]|nr:hypothetical protein [Xanthobacteraceae bacterium]
MDEDAKRDAEIAALRKEIRKTRNDLRRTVIVLIALAVAAFAFIDTPQTIGIKAYVVNMLPLDDGIKDRAILTLCRGAYGQDGAPESQGRDVIMGACILTLRADRFSGIGR